MADEVFEQLKFLGRNVNGLARLENATTPQVDLNLAEAVLVLIFGNDGGAPENRFYSRQEFTDRERLGHVVIGAKLKADHLIDLLAASRKHDDRDGTALGAQLLAHFQSTHARHHYVEHDKIGRLVECLLET